jgi:glycosyltransferase involved in cell wall biosynthesis
LLSDAERNDWLRASDLAVNPMFAGSGTNIKMFDFMAAGLPIVSTDIGARGIAVVSGGGLRLANRSSFVREVESLGAEKGLLRALGAQNRKWVEGEFAWESISPRVGDIVRAMVGAARASRHSSDDNALRLAHVSTVGQICGIGEYTARLIESLASQGVSNYIVSCATPKLRPAISDFPAVGEIGWQYDNETWRDSRIDDAVARRLADWRAQYVIVQYHPAFFSGETLIRFANECMKYGLRIAVVIHNFSLADKQSFQLLSARGLVLASHSVREVAVAADEGIFIEHLPLLVPTTVSSKARSIEGRDFLSAPPLIASVGFLRAHKGIPQLIEALPAVRERFPGARLLLQCALYPSDDSAQELKVCHAAIRRLGLEDAVDFQTSFEPIEGVHRSLSRADIAILPYGPSNEGGSAAAATVFASGVPLLISASDIFRDIMHVADVLPNTSPQSIAASIISLLENPSSYAGLSARSSRYAEEHSAASVAKRMLELLHADFGGVCSDKIESH